MKQNVKAALQEWDAFALGIKKATPVDSNETKAEQKKRVELLFNDWAKWCKFYFPNYCTADFADFQLAYANLVIKNKKIYTTRAWARDHAKSAITMMIVLYLVFKGEAKTVVIASYSQDNAINLLRPYKLQFENNQRLIHDFGPQVSLNWSEDEFHTNDGTAFYAIGSGQNPRGKRNEEIRPDIIVPDDMDTDEQCRNPERLDNAWKWLTEALFPTMSIKGGRWLMLGNIIAKDSLMTRAAEVSDSHEQVLIYKKGTPNPGEIESYEAELNTNPEKNRRKVLEASIKNLKAGLVPSWRSRFSPDECEWMIQKIGYFAAQKEYMGNPLVEGKVFKKDWIAYKKFTKLKDYRCLVGYLDPGFKKTKTSDTKALVLVGLMNAEFHIIRAYCDKASIEEMIGWCYDLDAYVKRNGGSFILKMEEVFLQSLLYKDFNEAAKTRGYPVGVSGDTRKKPEKDARIMATSGDFERGNVYFNELEKENPHMKRLIEQFLAFMPGINTHKDGPDAYEGARHILLQLIQAAFTESISIGKRQTNNKRV